MSNSETPNPATSAASAPQLALQAVYLKDCSFESPQGPRVTGEWNPQIGLDLNTALNMIEGDLREVVLTVTVSAKVGERTMFLVEVKQAGAFVMQNLSGEDLRRAAGASARVFGARSRGRVGEAGRCLGPVVASARRRAPAGGRAQHLGPALRGRPRQPGPLRSGRGRDCGGPRVGELR